MFCILCRLLTANCYWFCKLWKFTIRYLSALFYSFTFQQICLLILNSYWSMSFKANRNVALRTNQILLFYWFLLLVTIFSDDPALVIGVGAFFDFYGSRTQATHRKYLLNFRESEMPSNYGINFKCSKLFSVLVKATQPYTST